jgi:hypothetical protein
LPGPDDSDGILDLVRGGSRPSAVIILRRGLKRVWGRLEAAANDERPSVETGTPGFRPICKQRRGPATATLGSRPIGKRRRHLSPLPVADNRAIAAVSPKGSIVDPGDPRSLN